MTTPHPAPRLPPASGRTRSALVSTALILMLCAGPFLALLAMARPAQAVPGDRPVDVVIDSVTPTVSGPGTVIEVRGTLVNTTDIPVTDLTVRLQRGPALESRSELADNDSDPVEVTDSSTPFVDLPQTLQGSGTLSFSYTTSPEQLRLAVSGAYPLLVNVNGQAGSDPESRVGEQVILLPYLSAPPAAATQLSWLWPLVATPERNAAGVFTGTDLAASLRAGGRLDQALSALENAPGAGGSPAVPAVTLAVDPSLLDEVAVLAGGDYQVLVDGQQQTSSAGSTDAASWLTRLRSLAAALPVVSLPYADPDLGALITQGQRSAVERLLPDGPSGDLVQEILGVPPTVSIAWPPGGGAADPAIVDLLAEHGVTQVISQELLAFLAQPEDYLEPVSTIQTQSGPIAALVGDPVLSGLVQSDSSEPGALATRAQRFLSELVVTAVGIDDGADQDRHLLIAPQRDFDPLTAAALMQATTEQAWLGTVQATELQAAVSEPAARTVITPAPILGAIPRSELEPLVAAMRLRDDFASALTDPDSDLLSVDRALARASTINRPPDFGPAAVTDVGAAVAALRATVGIVAPANGTYSLASADAPLVLTVFNDNPFTVEVTVSLAPRGAPGVTTTNVVETLPAQTRTTIPVPANVERSGSFSVIASIRSPAGTLLGAPVQLRVQSTVYGPVALAITFGAGGLLALLFARRSVKYWKSRRSGGTEPIPAGAEESIHTEGAPVPVHEPTLLQPPPRSPV